MSYAAFSTTRDIKATRKQHVCVGCTKPILAGQPAWYFSSMYDGDFGHGYYHPECRALEMAWNDLAGNMWDEWQGLQELLDEMEPDDRIWIEVEWPVVADRIWKATA